MWDVPNSLKNCLVAVGIAVRYMKHETSRSQLLISTACRLSMPPDWLELPCPFLERGGISQFYPPLPQESKRRYVIEHDVVKVGATNVI